VLGPRKGWFVTKFRVDLSILGKDEVHLAEFETQVRKEYSWVPKLIFNNRRAEILQRFVDRERIYTHEHFVRRYEQSARRNLEDSIRKLNGYGDDHQRTVSG
jgi:predicted metal-dependent HD superfamily phosphohydrolase